MKKVIFLVLILVSNNLIGQITQDTLPKLKMEEKLRGLTTGKRIVYSEKDTIPIVLNIKASKDYNDVLFYLNGQVEDLQVLGTISSEKIEEMKIGKESISYKNVNYTGQIYVNTKDGYTPKLISLNALKAKYLTIADDVSTLFMLDNTIINKDYDEYKVDENYILKITVQEVKNSNENIDIVVITLVTRSKKNVEKANTIRIKGSEFYGINKEDNK